MSRILLVEGDATIAARLRGDGFDVELATTAEALERCEAFAPDVVIADIAHTGVELVKTLAATEHPPATVAVIAFGETRTVVEAMRAGAADRLTKPVDLAELRATVDKVLARARIANDVARLRRLVRERVMPGNIIGATPAMQQVLATIDQVAATRASVLVTGEIGTGKELVANAIHERSPRASAPFIALHCKGLAPALIECELFGEECDDATSRSEGRLALATGGTLFLDDIEHLAQPTQIKLLRVLQERRFERVGGTLPIAADVRVIAASSADLARGRLRDDLFYRLNVVAIALPPLRERSGDIPALARLFCERSARLRGKSIEGIAPDALERLVAYRWPGNVRELERAIDQAVATARHSTIAFEDLAASIVTIAPRTDVPKVPGASLAELERFAILETLAATGSTTRAAAMLRISPRTIQYRLHDYDAVTRPRAAGGKG